MHSTLTRDVLKLLEEVGKTADPILLGNWAGNPEAPPVIISAIARNPHTPPDVLQKLMDKEPYCVARNPNTSPNVLSKLAKSDNLIVVWGTAKNPNTDVEDLLWLLEHTVQVTQAVCQNPNLPYGRWFEDAVFHFRVIP